VVAGAALAAVVLIAAGEALPAGRVAATALPEVAGMTAALVVAPAAVTVAPLAVVVAPAELLVALSAVVPVATTAVPVAAARVIVAVLPAAVVDAPDAVDAAPAATVAPPAAVAAGPVVAVLPPQALRNTVSMSSAAEPNQCPRRVMCMVPSPVRMIKSQPPTSI